MNVPTYDELAELQVGHGYPWFTAPWDLNLICLRTDTVGAWDDLLVCAFSDDAGRQLVYPVTVTADAWAGEWTDPTNPDGCVYILDGRYSVGLTLGEHKGRPALRQVKLFDYVRWPSDRPWVPSGAELRALAESGARFSDICGTHAHNDYTTKSTAEPPVDSSEGCIVALHRHEWAGLIELVNQQGRHRGGVTVSLTVITLPDDPDVKLLKTLAAEVVVQATK